MIQMDPFEQYVRLCGKIGNYTERVTGENLVDAYTGPPELSPDRQKKDCDAITLLHEIGEIHDLISEEVEEELRQQYLLSEIDSFWTTMRWLSGVPLLYSDLVEGMFNIPLRGFREKDLDRTMEELKSLLRTHPGKDLHEKVNLFSKDGEVSGNELRDLIEKILQPKATSVGSLFREKIYSLMGREVTDNGVEYSCVTNKPWSGYNWYKGGFKSLNEFNIDYPSNRDLLSSTIYHEYEHHVSNLWREQMYNDTGNLELSIVPLHTGRCVISEGSADTAREFLGMEEDDERTQIFNTLYILRRMASINAAIMLNSENRSKEETINYLVERGLRAPDSFSLAFIQPFQDDDRPNFWAPYVFTYYFGRTDFVLPTFLKAKEEEQLPEFYRTLYLNPYSGSSLTWKRAFDWL